VVAVLAAVSEEIKSRSGSESNTEYFAALVSYASDILSCLFAVECTFSVLFLLDKTIEQKITYAVIICCV